jgi:hypothetical protein
MVRGYKALGFLWEHLVLKIWIRGNELVAKDLEIRPQFFLTIRITPRKWISREMCFAEANRLVIYNFAFSISSACIDARIFAEMINTCEMESALAVISTLWTAIGRDSNHS